ncbi:type IVB secretion system protein IcmH/DotU [Alsobacter sp. KACC 23698]|uniref:Type IVB secretion system protein IcmH/DotU n=1 Tax=Alsobacter sp. KACC 23698 TaxID=3149229 RepID=A0AAU7JMQ5_9HYPH
MPRAEDLRFDDLAAPHPNPIMRAAGPLLLLLGRLRVAMVRASFASLMEQVAAAIAFFDKDIRAAGVPPEQANVAKYLVCATADDIVQNIPTEDRHVWTQYSMLSRFFGERTGGVRFFEELDRLKNEPAANYDVLELQHACLALGFQGLHRTTGGGAVQLQTIQRNLYETLRRIRPKIPRELSLRWRGQELGARGSRLRVPVWAVAGVAAVSLFALFVALRTTLADASERVAEANLALLPNTPVLLQRRLPAPPPAPPPQSLTQLQRIRAGLGPGVDGCALGADILGRWIAIRVCSGIMFESGQASVLPQFKPVAMRIAQTIEKEAGPVMIVGHTDNQPLSPTNRFKNNQQLSVERARAAAALIASTFADPSRITTEGRGPDDPVADNKTAEGRARNRRVEFLVTRID